MPPAKRSEPKPDAAAALLESAAASARLRHRVLVFTITCSTIALLLWAMQSGGFGANLVYSFAVGSCCWLFIEGLRRGTAVLVRWRRRWFGLPALSNHKPGVLATLPLVALGAAAGAPLGLWIGDMLTGHKSPSLLQWQSPATRFTLAITLIASLIIVFAISTREQLAEARAAAEAAQRRATEAQLKLLESQLEPHMLFNTLANLRVLIGVDPPRAQVMLDHLIAFLRATLSATRGDLNPGAHTLAAEFDRVADYLALMGLRMGARLVVRLDLPEALRGAATPPLLLQPLVENSIRHGLEPKVAPGRIEVTAMSDNDQLVLTVRDTGVGLDAEAAAGAQNADTHFGLAQIRARLHALYGERAFLTLAAAGGDEGGAVAQVRLPLTLPMSLPPTLPPTSR